MSFQIPIKIYFSDTDALGMVYHAQYLCLFDKARTEYFQQAGFSISKMIQEHYGLVVRQASLKYHKPARLGQTYQCTVEPESFKKASFTLRQKIFDEYDLYCSAVINLAYIHLETMKPVKIPQLMIDLFNQMELNSAK